MTAKIIPNDRIRAEVLQILSGYRQRLYELPKIYVLSPWISDVQLTIDADVLGLDESWFGLDYGIFSINLAYAMLLVKLVFGAEINIVTNDPLKDEKYRDREYSLRAFNLIDFLDEVSCRVFLARKLHSTLILTNDLALSGSFDLSESEVYNENENGVLINDLDNIKTLEEYAIDTINSSTVYGYTARAVHPGSSIIAKATRGWLYEMIAENYFPKARFSKRDSSYTFLTEHIGTKSVYFDGMVKEIASDLETFYVNAILQALMDGENRSIERNFAFLQTLGYKGKMEFEEVMNFLRTKLAREHVPKIPLRMLSTPEYFKKPC
jgi:hypothetical protein